MRSLSQSRSSIVSNLAVLAVTAVIIAVGVDFVLTKLGYPPALTCVVVPPLVTLGHTIGLVLVVTGLILWTISGFGRPTGPGILFSGLAIYIGPLMLMSAMGLSCG